MTTEPADTPMPTGATVDERTLEWIRTQLTSDAALLGHLIKLFADQLMAADADRLCRADNGSGERINWRNGYRAARFDTPVGIVNVSVPRLRRGTYAPTWLLLDPMAAADTIAHVACRAYVLGVSAELITDLIVTLGIAPLPSSRVDSVAAALDAAVAAVRLRPLDNGAFRELALRSSAVPSRRDNGWTARLATSESDGRRHVLSLEVSALDDETGWRRLVRGLVERGLDGVDVVTTDVVSAAARRAVRAEFPDARYVQEAVEPVPAPARADEAAPDRSVPVIIVRNHGRDRRRVAPSVSDERDAASAVFGRHDKTRRRHIAPILAGVAGVVAAITLAAMWRNASGPASPPRPSTPSSTTVATSPALPAPPPPSAAPVSTPSTNAACAANTPAYADLATNGQRSPWLQVVLCAAARS